MPAAIGGQSLTTGSCKRNVVILIKIILIYVQYFISGAMLAQIGKYRADAICQDDRRFFADFCFPASSAYYIVFPVDLIFAKA